MENNAPPNVPPYTTADQRFNYYDGTRQGMLTRLETYSRWTIAKLFPRVNREQDQEPLTHGFQSLGAQAVNHLANKLMMALFAPSRPFFRLELAREARKKYTEAGQEVLADMQGKLAAAEQEASLELDKKTIRPRLYDLLKMLIVLGNALLVIDSKKKTVRVLNLRHYVVKRTEDGTVCEMVIKEQVNKDNLEPAVYAQVAGRAEFKPDDKGNCFKFRWITFDGRKYKETVWIDDVRLNGQYDSTYSPDKLPYRAVTWDLAAGDDYGTGLVEDYEGDFMGLVVLSEATIQAAILASQFRWIVNPTGMTSVEDFQASPNGGAIPGVKGDIELLSSGVENNLQTNLALQQTYVNRIGAGFLLQTAITRNAERVTAEEIRMNAEELEGSLGGAYSRIATDVQLPIAFWTLSLIGKDVAGTDIEPVIITGLAALSRSGDRDRLLAFGRNLASVLTMPPVILGRLKLSAWIADFAAAEGLDPSTYVYTESEFQAMQRQAAQAQLAMQNAQQQIDNQNNPEINTQ